MRNFFLAALAVAVFCFCIGCGEDADNPLVEDVVDPIGPVSVSLSRTTLHADPNLALIGDTVILTLESQTDIPVKQFVQFTIAEESYKGPVDITLEPGSAFRYTAEFVVDKDTPTGPVGFSFTHETTVVSGDTGSVTVVSPAEMAKIVTDRMRPKVDAIFDEIIKIQALGPCMGVIPLGEFRRKGSDLLDSLRQVFEEEPGVRAIMEDHLSDPTSLLDSELMFIHERENFTERHILYSTAVFGFGCDPWYWRPFELLVEYLRLIYAFPDPDSVGVPDYIIQHFVRSAKSGLTTLLRPEEIEQGLAPIDVMRMQRERLENLGEEHAQWLKEWEEEQEE